MNENIIFMFCLSWDKLVVRNWINNSYKITHIKNNSRVHDIILSDFSKAE